MSHSIYMLGIQSNTKSLELISPNYYEIKNVLIWKPYETEFRCNPLKNLSE